MDAPPTPSADASAPESRVAARQLLRVPGAKCFSVSGGRKVLVAQGGLLCMEVHPDGKPVCTFLMMGDFTYPLVNQVILRVDSTHWVLPSDGGLSWGLVIQTAGDASGIAAETGSGGAATSSGAGAGAGAGGGAGKPGSVSAAGLDERASATEIEALGALFARTCQVHDQATNSEVVYDETKDPASESYWAWGAGVVSSAVVAGSAWLADTLVVGASWAGAGLGYGADYLKSAIAPATEKVEISEATKAGLERAKLVSGTAVSLTSTLVDAVTAAAVSFGTSIADAFSATSAGQAVVEGASSEAGQAVKSVAVSGLVAAGNILAGLEKAASELFSQSAAATKEVVGHAYGDEAGKAVESGFEVAGDVGRTAWNVKRLGTGSFVRATTTGAAVELLGDEDGSAHDAARRALGADTSRAGAGGAGAGAGAAATGAGAGETGAEPTTGTSGGKPEQSAKPAPSTTEAVTAPSGSDPPPSST